MPQKEAWRRCWSQTKKNLRKKKKLLPNSSFHSLLFFTVCLLYKKSASQIIAKGIQTSDLGITPQIDGQIIRVNIPPMTEETRKDVVKVLKQRSEQSKISIRNIRRDIQDEIRKLEKNGDCSEDDSRRAIIDLQKLTDDSIKIIDQESSLKESEIMQV